MSGTMNNTLQSPKTRVSTSCYHVARVKESSPLTSHVSSKTQLFQSSNRRKHCKPSSQMNHVEGLFPEFFNRKSDNTLNRSFKMNRDPDEGQKQPLTLYGGDSQHQTSLVLSLFTKATPERYYCIEGDNLLILPKLRDSVHQSFITDTIFLIVEEKVNRKYDDYLSLSNALCKKQL